MDQKENSVTCLQNASADLQVEGGMTVLFLKF